MSDLTPMMKQYFEIKSKNKDCILFFRLGDFYEMFGDDAVTASKILQIALTSRGSGDKRQNKIPMCGVPFHAANGYIIKLINSGYKVAICEQIEDPKEAKGIVKRDIVKIITPGTVIDENALDKKENNYILSIYYGKNSAALCAIDVSTGEFLVKEFDFEKTGSIERMTDEVELIKPSELIIPSEWKENKVIADIINKIKIGRAGVFINEIPAWNFDLNLCRQKLMEHFMINSLESFGIDNKPEIISASGALLGYLYDTQKNILKHINSIRYISGDGILYMDSVALRNLEITDSYIPDSSGSTLYSVLDATKTAMGGRELRKWLKTPLFNLKLIQERLDKVEYLFNNRDFAYDLGALLSDMADIERISGKLGSLNVNARDLNSLKFSLEKAIKLDGLLLEHKSFNHSLGTDISEIKQTIQIIKSAIVEEPPVSIKEGGIINTDYSEELKKIRDLSVNGKDFIANLQETERKRTGINSLKVGYTSVFGYYIEVSKANLKNVPDDYIRKQTLVNAERFITPQLKDYESMVLNAQERLVKLEYEIFCEVRDKLIPYIRIFQDLSRKIAELDCLLSFAECSYSNNYVKPKINLSNALKLVNSRHPVIEKNILNGDFIPNDCFISGAEPVMIITGPNMAGKSTYMRQVCLCVIMAQCGCFVPAEYAEIGLVDRIFTRIGASDYIARGQSTFMVEMIETANILNNATEKSLIVLDEVGRGTSTFDGISIAWAITEYIHDKIKAKTLFATHYFELTEIADIMKGVKNYSVEVKEWGDKIVFMRKIKEGSTDKSYGIHVAKLAGIPESVIKRANRILKNLENANYTKDGRTKIGIGADSLKEPEPDLFTYAYDKSFLSDLENLDTDNMTPLEALNKIKELKDKYC